jgi:hypothetical protein
VRGFNGKYTQHNNDHESNSDSGGTHIQGNNTDSDSERISSPSALTQAQLNTFENVMVSHGYTITNTSTPTEQALMGVCTITDNCLKTEATTITSS